MTPAPEHVYTLTDIWLATLSGAILGGALGFVVGAAAHARRLIRELRSLQGPG